MIVLLSPAKALNTRDRVPDPSSPYPALIDLAAQLMERLRHRSVPDLAALFKVSEKTATLNSERFQQWSVAGHATDGRPALYTFNGPVYKAMNPWDFDEHDRAFADRHLAILSGLYGLLTPLEPILPYRLDMGTKLQPSQADSLADFWRPELTGRVAEAVRSTGAEAVLNLASAEYTSAIDAEALPAPIIDCRFEERVNDGYRQTRNYVKQARGLMARFIVKQRVERPEAARAFSDAGYRFAPDPSDQTTMVFRRY